MDQFVCEAQASPSSGAESQASRILFDASRPAEGGQCSPRKGVPDKTSSEQPTESLVKILPKTEIVVKKPEPFELFPHRAAPPLSGWDTGDKIEHYLSVLEDPRRTFFQTRMFDVAITRKQLDGILSSDKTDQYEKEVARFLQKNFDDLSRLDDKKNSRPDHIERADLDLFADGHRQISMDKRYFNDAKKFAVSHFTEIDRNRDNKIDAPEIRSFVEANKLTAEEVDAASYLTHRLGEGTPFFDRSLKVDKVDGKLSFGRSELNRGGEGSLLIEQILSMNLSQRIDQTERSLYVSRTRDKYERIMLVVGTVGGFAAGALAGLKIPALLPYVEVLPFGTAFVQLVRG